MPLLLYATEATAPSRHVVHMMNRCVDTAVRKIFSVSGAGNCVAIRSALGLDRVGELIRRQSDYRCR